MMRRCTVLVLVPLLLATLALAGDKDQIRADMQAGRWAAADQGLQQVLQAHPNSAVAHYWMAEVKEREGQLPAARAHLAKARTLKPDLSFASNPLIVEEMERRLLAGGEASTAGGGIAWGWLGGGLLLLGALVFWFLRSQKQVGADETARYREVLKQIAPELRDAEKAIDARSDWSPEQRFAYAERVAQAQGDVAKAQYALPTMTDFSGVDALLLRVRDLSAEIRGEEKPSERDARLRMAQAQQGTPASAGQTVAVESGVSGGLLTGVVLGSLMGSAGRASAQVADEGGQRIDTAADGNLSTLDFGRDDVKDDWQDSTANFDSGPDTTTDSGNDDNW